RKPSIGILKQELDRIDEDYADDEEYDEATTDVVDAASLLFSEPSANEIALLKQMRVWAEKASGQLDSKVKCLIDWLNTHIRPGKVLAEPAVRVDARAGRVAGRPLRRPDAFRPGARPRPGDLSVPVCFPSLKITADGVEVEIDCDGDNRRPRRRRRGSRSLSS